MGRILWGWMLSLRCLNTTRQVLRARSLFYFVMFVFFFYLEKETVERGIGVCKKAAKRKTSASLGFRRALPLLTPDLSRSTIRVIEVQHLNALRREDIMSTTLSLSCATAEDKLSLLAGLLLW